MAKKSRLNQRMYGKSYEGYDTQPIDSRGEVFCPRCADSSKQNLEVEVMQHSYMPGQTRATFMVHCGRCKYDYAFMGVYDTTLQTMQWTSESEAN